MAGQPHFYTGFLWEWIHFIHSFLLLHFCGVYFTLLYRFPLRVRSTFHSLPANAVLTGYRQVFPCVTLDNCTPYSFSSQSNLFRVWSKLFNCAGIDNTLFLVGGLKPRSICWKFYLKVWFESLRAFCFFSTFARAVPSLPRTSRAGREGWKYLSPAETCLSPLKGASVTQPFSNVPFSNEAAPLTHLRRLEPLSYFNIVNCNPFGWPFGFGDMGWFFRCTTIYNPQTRFDENAFWWTLTSKRLFLWHIMISTCWKQCRSKWISRIDLYNVICFRHNQRNVVTKSQEWTFLQEKRATINLWHKSQIGACTLFSQPPAKQWTGRPVWTSWKQNKT